MSWLPIWPSRLLRRLRALFRPGAVDREMDEEIRLHIELETEDLMRTEALPREEARRRALVAFGGVDRYREQTRDARGVRPLEDIWRDVRYGTRSLRRSPGLSTVIVVSFAVVLGANTTIFSLVDAMFLRRLSLPHPEQLVTLERYHRPVYLHYAEFQAVRSAPGIPRLEGYHFIGETVRANGSSEGLWVDRVTGGYFDLLGVRPILGRVLDRTDEAGGAAVAVISEEYWASRFGRRRDVLGRTLTLNGLPVTIVGVLPRTFHGLFFAGHFSIAVPFTIGDPDYSGQLAVDLIGRLDPKRSRVSQAAVLNAALRHCCLRPTASGSPPTTGARGRSVPAGSASPSGATAAPAPPGGPLPDDWPAPRNAVLYGGGPAIGPPVTFADASHGLTWSTDYRARFRSVLIAVMAGGLLLLLVACANVATLLVARAEARQAEFAVRLSLGAGRRRLLVQLLTEALDLAGLGALLGLMFAWGATSVLRASLPPSALALSDVIRWRPNWPIFAFSAGVVVLCTVLVCIWPARLAGRVDLVSGLSGAHRHVAGRWSADRSLVVAQVALAVVLVSTSALLALTLRNLTTDDGGYHSRDVILASVEIRDDVCNGSYYEADIGRCLMTTKNDALRLSVYHEVRTDLTRVGRVAGVGLASDAPLASDMYGGTRATVGSAMTADSFVTRSTAVTPGFLAASGIGVVAGRDFLDSDVATSEPVVVVSQAFAERRYPGRSALGAALTYRGWFGEPHTARIVGIARDANYRRINTGPSLRNPAEEIFYQPLAQTSPVSPNVTLIVRTTGDPNSVAGPVRRTLDGISGVKAARITSVGAVLNDMTARERFGADLGGAFAAMALLLAAIGVYGVLSYSVVRRTRELGVRTALGASTEDNLRLVLSEALVMVGIGVVAGLPVAVGVARISRSLLYGVSEWDPRALVGGAALLTVVSLLGGLLPARRATRVDPLVALRSE